MEERKSEFNKIFGTNIKEFINEIKQEEEEIREIEQEEKKINKVEQEEKKKIKQEENKKSNLIKINNNYKKDNKDEKVFEPDEIIDGTEYQQEEQENEKYNKYAEILNEYGYSISGPKLVYKETKELSNFIPIITKKVIHTNGVDEIIKYKLEAILLDDITVTLDEVEVSKNEFESFQFIIGMKNNWDKYAIIRPNCEKYLKEVAQLLARYTMEEETIFENTGFERINGKLVYLYAGGAIGGNEGEIKAELTEGGLGQYCFTNKEFDVKEALQTSYSIFYIAKEKVSIPIMAYTYITPIVSLLKEKDIFCDFILMFVGRTNTGKSSMAAIANSHFGNFTKNSFNSSLDDSTSKVTRQAYILKDALLVPDDLNPEIGNKKLKLVEDIIGFVGNRQGPGRANSDGTIRGTYYPRGTVILTAEFIPNVPDSRLSRTIILDFDENTVNVEKLNDMQKKENREKLAFSMMQYIKWLIDNENRIINECSEEIQKIRKIQINKGNDALGNSENARNILYLGIHLFLQFLKEYQVISEEKQAEIENKSKNILNEIMKEQGELMELNDPIEMFYSAMRILYETRKITFVDYGNGTLLHFNGRNVGYADGNRLYLYWKSKTEHPIYDEVCDYYRRRGTKFPLTAPVLLKELDKRGLLEKTGDKKSKTVYKTDPIDKIKIKVINIAKYDKPEDEENENI